MHGTAGGRGRRKRRKSEGMGFSLSSVLFARFIAAGAGFAGLIESGTEFNVGIINGPRN